MMFTKVFPCWNNFIQMSSSSCFNNNHHPRTVFICHISEALWFIILSYNTASTQALSLLGALMRMGSFMKTVPSLSKTQIPFTLLAKTPLPFRGMAVARMDWPDQRVWTSKVATMQPRAKTPSGGAARVSYKWDSMHEYEKSVSSCVYNLVL